MSIPRWVKARRRRWADRPLPQNSDQWDRLLPHPLCLLLGHSWTTPALSFTRCRRCDVYHPDRTHAEVPTP